MTLTRTPEIGRGCVRCGGTNELRRRAVVRADAVQPYTALICGDCDTKRRAATPAAATPKPAASAVPYRTFDLEGNPLCLECRVVKVAERRRSGGRYPRRCPHCARAAVPA